MFNETMLNDLMLYGYYFYHLEDQKVFVSKRAMFLEKEHILRRDRGSMKEFSEGREPNSKIIQQHESIHVPSTQVSTLNRSGRIPHPLKRYVGHIIGDGVEDIDLQTYNETITSINSGK